MSHKELSKKIKTAKKIVSEGDVRVLNRAAMIADALELGYLFENEFSEILSDLLNNTEPEHYTGTKPPQKSYETDILGLEIFAFRVKSSILDPVIYYKFCIKNNCCYIISLHEDRGTE